MNHRCTNHKRIEIAELENLVYLGSVLDKHRGMGADIKMRPALARGAFSRLQSIWRSGRFSQKTKLRIRNQI